MSIYYIDEIMGRGKTSAMINYINQSSLDDRFMFITPYLTEVDRVRDACSGRNFQAPDAEGGKLNNIKKLIHERHNIVSTHALFMRFDEEAIQMVKEAQYTLIMDEVPAAITQVSISTHDAKIITDEKLVETLSDGKLRWIADDYTGKYDQYRELIKNGFTYQYSDTFWLAMMPPSLYTSYKDVYVMTYMFRHQFVRCYFDLMKMPYTRKYIAGDSPETYRLSDTFEPTPPVDFRNLIHIVDNKRMNAIGDERGSLSKSWYVRNSRKTYMTDEMKKLRNNVSNFFKNVAASPSRLNLWTTYLMDEEAGVDWKRILGGNGYMKGFLQCTARGTNSYRHKQYLAYLINIYPNTCTKNFLHTIGVELNQDYYALSEMLQWIWRSAVRDGKPITIYIPSRRMRELLIRWMEAVAAPGREITLEGGSGR